MTSPPDALEPTVETPAQRRAPGRPYGSKARITRDALRFTHFSFMRAAIEGVPLRTAWLRYLAFGGDADDERHFRHRLHSIAAQIRVGAALHGLGRLAETALQPLEHRLAAVAAQALLGPRQGETATGQGSVNRVSWASRRTTPVAEAMTTTLRRRRFLRSVNGCASAATSSASTRISRPRPSGSPNTKTSSASIVSP